MNKKKFALSTTWIIVLSFLVAIFIGSILLYLPISTADGKGVSYLDALFTSTTATCVTGLVTLPTASTWSIFGQIVLLILIQIGGLGVVTVVSGFMISLNKKFSFKDRLLLQDTFNLNSLSGIVAFVKKVIKGTLIVEGIGAALYMTVFVPEFGAKGIWISVFNSVSAFCNAGIDIIAENSLCSYMTNPVINFTTMLLIILGGIGYIVWWDVIRVAGLTKQYGIKSLKKLTLHSKIAISTTLLLIFGGALIVFIFEADNPLTIKDSSLFEKLQFSLFQSVTTRTAGFATVPQENLTNGASFISLVMMFIGGSPVGTAGGIKTVTAAVVFATVMSTIKNRNETELFNRTLPQKAISKAVAVCGMSFVIMLLSTFLLTLVCDAPALDILYETVSATATVGLTRNLTASLNSWGKIIIIGTMYLGRIGPISLAFAFGTRKENKNIIRNPVEEISIG